MCKDSSYDRNVGNVSDWLICMVSPIRHFSVTVSI